MLTDDDDRGRHFLGGNSFFWQSHCLLWRDHALVLTPTKPDGRAESLLGVTVSTLGD